MLAPVLLLPRVLAIAEEAGAVILRHYREGTTVTTKADASPVTAADEAGEAIILAGLRELTPNLPIVAEEAVARGEAPDVGDGPFWLVDPLDGTKEFISGNGEFTVNIGLIDQRRPVLGVVLAPARGLAWWGASGQAAPAARGAMLVARSRSARRPAAGAVAVASRSHRDAATDAWLAEREDRRHRVGRQLAQVLPGRRGQGRRLPAVRADHGMGHGGRRCRAARGRRPVRPPTAPVRSTASPASATRASSPGAPDARDRPLAPASSSRSRRPPASPAPARGGAPCRGPAAALAAGRPAPDLPRLRVRLAGLELPHPLGLAAGLRQERRGLRPRCCGTASASSRSARVTPRPQPGNPRPRLFRLADDRAIINRMGFNNDGLDAVAAPARRRGDRRRGVVGVNIGMNKDAADPAADYVAGAARASRRLPTTSRSTSPRRTRPGCARCRDATRWRVCWQRAERARSAARSQRRCCSRSRPI